IDNIVIAPDKNRGQKVSRELRFKNVADELEGISKESNIGWNVYVDIPNKLFVFDVVEPKDLSNNNDEGNTPVFFSPQFNNIENQTLVDSLNDYKNFGYIGGQGEGVERKIINIGDEKGLNRYEMFIDARDIGEAEAGIDEDEEESLTEEEIEKLLIDRGKSKLNEHKRTFFLEAQIVTPSFPSIEQHFALQTFYEYETDFNLGDTVDVFNSRWGVTMSAPITEFKEIHEEGGFLLEATFGEAQPTLIKKIKNKFDDLEGI